MHEQDLAMVKGLISVAWADGQISSDEGEVIAALLEAFRATPSEVVEVHQYAKTKRTLDDVPVAELSYDDRRVLLQHAVLLAHVDGVHHEDEKALLDGLCKKLRIPDVEALGIIEAAERRAAAVPRD
jgi:tellurite resistance protein